MMHAQTLGYVYRQWVTAKSEYSFEKWLRTQIVRASQHLTVDARRKLLRPLTPEGSPR